MQRGNFFSNIPDASAAEVVETLSRMHGGAIRIERIVTEGQSTPAGEWYNQNWAEWVIVLRGGAELEFADPAGIERLDAGDWILIPSERIHRVSEALPGTLWLAVHADSP